MLLFAKNAVVAAKKSRHRRNIGGYPRQFRDWRRVLADTHD